MPLKQSTILLGVGDVAPCRDNPGSMFTHVAPILRSGDVVFGQLETNISDRGSRCPSAKLAMRTRPENAAAIREAGFTHMSFAGNHCMDWGRDAFSDTLEYVADSGIALFGAGRDIVAARRPALADVNGTRIAFLGYSSILPEGYWADAARPGCAPMRAHTLYEQIEHDQPGTPARIHTFPHREDLAQLVADVRAAKANAEVVALSMHWGIHFVPGEIAAYQRIIAHAAIDAGADVILGHHPHILKGIEVYNGRPIFYSLGNFAIEQPWAFEHDVRSSASYSDIKKLNDGWEQNDKYMLPPETRNTMIAKLTIADGAIQRATFIPAYLTDSSEPEPLTEGDARFRQVVQYVDDISQSQGLGTRFKVSDGEVEICDGA